MQASSIWDLGKTADSNVRLSVHGKAVNGKEFFGSLSQSVISERSSNVDRKEALKRARFQIFEAAMLGEDRLYRRTE